MQLRAVRSVVPVLLALTAFGCGAERKLVGSAPSSEALRADAAAAANSAAGAPGAVYTSTNGAGGNAVLAFARYADGSLGAPQSFATGGTGTGAGLGNQGSLALGDGARWLFVVNAGSNDVSAFRVTASGLSLAGRTPSGGTMPISVTAHHDLVYVLNAGGSGNIQGFRVSDGGALSPIAGSNRPLSTSASGPAQVGFTPDGSEVVVTEKATNAISVYEVASDGSASGPETRASSGPTPFGFGFDRTRTLVVSEAFGGAANASAVSSYRIGANGALAVVSGSVHTDQTAACWIAVQQSGRFAYTTNAGSSSISGYAVSANGSLTHLSGATPSVAGPSEMALGAGGRFLYVLGGRAQAIGAYAVSADGALAAVSQAGGLPAGLNGLAAR